MEPGNREDFIHLLISEQAQRNFQFTLRDADLIQIVLEIIYCPIFKPIVGAPVQGDVQQKQIFDQVAQMDRVKLTKFSKETVQFIENDVLNWIDTAAASSAEVLEASEHQATFIRDHLLKHISIGKLQIVSELYFAHLQRKTSD